MGFTTEQLITAIREADSLEDLQRMVGPSEQEAQANDRDLIERAARAAGLDCKREDEHDSFMVRGSDLLWRPWNPLSEKADAMGLILKLGICLTISAGFTQACRSGGSAEVDHGDDMEAATLRAITLAAAGR